MPQIDDVKTVQLCRDIRTRLATDHGFVCVVVDRTDGMVSIASDFAEKEQLRQIFTFVLKNLDDTESQFFPAGNPSRLN